MEIKEVERLISVIIPIYNSEKYLCQCLDSVINQSYTCLEIILVDDGSTDKSGEICEQYAKCDKRIRVFHQENAGVSSARNLGLNNSSGTYITFVDSDDFISKEYCQKIYKAMSVVKGADIVSCGFNFQSKLIDNIEGGVVTKEKCFLGGAFRTVWGALIRRDILNDLRFNTNISYGEDMLFIKSVVLRANVILWIPDILYYYRKNADSATCKPFSEARWMEYKVWHMILNDLAKNSSEWMAAAATIGADCKAWMTIFRKDELFMKKYYSQVKKTCRRYLIYTLKYADSFSERVSLIINFISPRAFNVIRNFAKENVILKNPKHKKIYVHAYCQMNLGDDLLIKILVERYPEQSFYVFCNPNKNKAIKNMPNTKVPTHFCWLIYSILLRMHIIKHGYGNFFKRKMSDVVVRIGGSIFMEIPGWKNDFCPYFLNKNIYYINCNFGPYKTEDYFQFVEKKIGEAQDCCFRDLASYKLFAANDNVRVAPDIGFLTKIPDDKCERKTIIVSVIEVEERGLWNYYKLLAEFCDQMIREGYKVKLMSFCEHEGDVKAMNKICRLSKLNSKLEMYNYQGDLDEAIRFFNSGNYVVASRFHALILGWKFCKKVFPIVYSDKQLNVMKDIGFEGHYMDLRNKTDYSIADIKIGCLNNPIIDISDATKRADLQFKAFDKYIFI